ncbi:unnamed protein product [Amoebophrya sp. A25]|nr:unnamed protein product [Amoebophrya sp. A25]|eukprot:GSA25T00014667001.1
MGQHLSLFVAVEVLLAGAFDPLLDGRIRVPIQDQVVVDKQEGYASSVSSQEAEREVVPVEDASGAAANIPERASEPEEEDDDKPIPRGGYRGYKASSRSSTASSSSSSSSRSPRMISAQDPDLTRKIIENIGPESALYHVKPTAYYFRDDHVDGWLSPDFETIHRKLYGVSPEEHHVVKNFTNPYGLPPTFGKFPHSNLMPEFFLEHVLDRLGTRREGLYEHLPKVNFIVEVGSFQGHSAVLIASILDSIAGLEDIPVLCIDPWTGDLNIWANREWDADVQHWASPVRDGRSLLFDQFMTNVQFKVSKHLSPNHILPFHATSTVGARFLKAMKWHPEVIFLDSAHEEQETLIELRLYYEVLAPGGILFGDDFNWPGVKNDVLTFVAEMGWGRDPERVFDFHILPATTTSGGSVLLWLLHKAKYV